ncbi:glycosyltransferase family 2 protein [Hymenobacter arizonensis]|uniref:Glycosyltransferase involved in cell wall bisynthesis n=1 Tax=Hymenobacter arizonensis TaxID=1227077 RepID=A0A1I5YRG9_HYMAR|nr:glycosyltransferase [Hymenobacter arizonensis]SFQ46690.1 Glycosyltransferase involved in cell wall bisynthesis [Hymenobacter arizonensis]
MVTIIIPCYNYGWLLPQTLDSMLAQTYKDWECIIIDDGSTDNSRSIGEAYAQRDSRFRYHYQTNCGMSAARNKGLTIANGLYVQFLDADDLLTPRKLEIQVSFLESRPEVDLVYSDVRYFLHEQPARLSQSMDMKDQRWMSFAEGQGECLINAVVEKNLMVVNAPLTRAGLLHKAGFFAEDLRSAEDWEYWVRCALFGGHFCYDRNPESLALVRVHPTSTSQNVKRFHDYVLIVRERIGLELHRRGLWKATQINELAKIESFATLGAHYLEKGNILDGVKIFLVLARTTGNYRYYLGSIGYWLKIRINS